MSIISKTDQNLNTIIRSVTGELTITDVKKAFDESLAHPDFKTNIGGYSDALLLNCIENEIWESASLDSAGLKKLYRKNREQYHVTGFDGLIIRFSDVKAKQKLEFEINNSDLKMDELASDLQGRYGEIVEVEEVLVRKGESSIIDHFIWKQSRFESAYTLIMVKGETIHLPSENFDEVISDVVIDYKEIAEDKWIRELRKRYKIRLNRKLLKGL